MPAEPFGGGSGPRHGAAGVFRVLMHRNIRIAHADIKSRLVFIVWSEDGIRTINLAHRIGHCCGGAGGR